jgi:hypothetical protein
MAEGCKASQKLLDILDVPDLAYFIDGQDLVGVCFDTALGNYVP